MKKIVTWTVLGSMLACSAGACSSGNSNGAGPLAVAGSSGAPSVAGAGGSANVAGTGALGGAASGNAGANSAGAASSAGGSAGAGFSGASGANAGGAAAAGAAGTSGSSAGGATAGGAAGSSAGGAGGGASTDVIAGLLALAKQPCANVVSKHDYGLDDGSKVSICATIGASTTSGAVFWTGDMDIDCDGKSTTECNVNTDCCYQNDTAFHNQADEPLTASVTPYVVIPQDFKFAGLNDGTVIAVIYDGKITYAVWGDTGPTDIIGEASYATAKSLGINPDAKVGGVGGKVVTYVAFLGKQAVPKDLEDRAEVEKLGPQLAQALIAK